MHLEHAWFQRQKAGTFTKNFGLRAPHSSNFFNWLITIFTRHHPAFIFGVGGLFLILEVLEHLSIIRVFSFFFVIEALLSVVLLSLSSYLISRLLIASGESKQANKTLHLKHDISTYLSASRDLEEVSKRLAQKTAQIVPSSEINLFLFDENQNIFYPLAYDSLKTAALRDATLAQGGTQGLNIFEYGPCHLCATRQSGTAHPLRLCQQRFGPAARRDENGYCLPLMQGSVPVGLLHLHPQMSMEQVGPQIMLLGSATGEISSALKVAMEYQVREENLVAQKIRDVQLDIARDLHDSIGQNISYLRMRLERLTETADSTKTELASDIERMSGVANETYGLIRGTLSVLQAGDSDDLQQLFTRYASQVAERAKFELIYQQKGRPKEISALLMRQMFYVFRELISNIEKHARATQVSILLNWQENQLALTVEDNGQGFNPDRVNYSSHYGLTFMRERVKTLHGSFTIQSEILAGATIQVLVPYE